MDFFKALLKLAAGLCWVLQVLCSMASSWASRREEQGNPCLYCELWEQCGGTSDRCTVKRKDETNDTGG